MLGVAFLALLLGASANARTVNTSSVASSSDNSTLIYAQPNDYACTTLDPGKADCGFVYSSQIYQHLVFIHKSPSGQLSIVPQLATSWSHNAHFTSYTFHLRHNAYFVDVENGQIVSHDHQVTSADVKFSLLRLWYLQTELSNEMNGFKNIQTPDPYTVIVNLKSPDVTFLIRMSAAQSMIYDSKQISAHGGLEDASAETADKAQAYFDTGASAGSGPYYLSSYVPNDTLVLKRNPYYWGPAPKLETIVIKDIPDVATEKQLLDSGSVDIAQSIDLQTAEAMKNDPGVTVKFDSGALDYTELFMNNRPQFVHYHNKLVRQAIFWALDYKGMLALDGGHAVNMPTVIPQGVFACCGVAGYHQDIAKAKALLAKAGYPHGFSDKLSYHTETDEWGPESLLAQKVQSDLARIGIKLTLVPYGDDYDDVKAAGKIGFGVDGWGGIADPDQFFADQYVSSFNYLTKRLGFHDPRIDALYPKSLATTGKQRLKIYDQLQKYALDDAIVIGIIQPDAALTYRSNVHGYQYLPEEYQTDLSAIWKSGS